MPQRVPVDESMDILDSEDDREWGSFEQTEIPDTYAAPLLPPRVTSLNGQDLQVIAKLASIELTPEQPKYGGGSCHVEEMRNERIVATTCVYLESENITETRIEFRTAVRPPMYEQNDDTGLLNVFDLRDQGPCVQPRGSSRTFSGRALAWLNTLQHRVRPFELSDPTRQGRRTV